MITENKPLDEILKFTKFTKKGIILIEGGANYLMNIVKGMLADGFDVSKFAEYTELPFEIVKDLAAELTSILNILIN